MKAKQMRKMMSRALKAEQKALTKKTKPGRQMSAEHQVFNELDNGNSSEV